MFISPIILSFNSNDTARDPPLLKEIGIRLMEMLFDFVLFVGTWNYEFQSRRRV